MFKNLLRKWLLGTTADVLPEKKSSGVFSTHAVPSSRLGVQKLREAVIANNIQRTPDDFTPKLADGSVAAMDATRLRKKPMGRMKSISSGRNP